MAVIAAAVGGDRDSMGRVIELALPSIRMACTRYRINEADAADFRQNVCVKILIGLHTFRGQAKFSSWVFRMAANEILMAKRSATRRVRHEIVGDAEGLLGNVHASDADPETAHVESDRHVSLHMSILRLPVEQQQMLRLHYGEGLRLQDVGERLGMSEPAVRSVMFRIRHHLRVRLLAEDRGEISVDTSGGLPPLMNAG